MATLAERIDKRTSTRVLKQQLGLENLKRHSFQNVVTGANAGNQTVRSGSVEEERLNEGRPTLIPFVYDGRVVDIKEAVERAVKSKRVWPSFDTNEQATVASKAISARIEL